MHMAQGGALNNDAFGNDVFGFPMKPDDFQDELTAIGAYTVSLFIYSLFISPFFLKLQL